MNHIKPVSCIALLLAVASTIRASEGPANLIAYNGKVLTGVKVVEFGGMGPGPFAGMVLADQGAEVHTLKRPDYIKRMYEGRTIFERGNGSAMPPPSGTTPAGIRTFCIAGRRYCRRWTGPRRIRISRVCSSGRFSTRARSSTSSPISPPAGTAASSATWRRMEPER